MCSLLFLFISCLFLLNRRGESRTLHDRINRIFCCQIINTGSYCNIINIQHAKTLNTYFINASYVFIVFVHRNRMNSAQALGHKWLKTAEQQKALSKTKLKRYVIKKQWIRATNTILALSRMGAKLE